MGRSTFLVINFCGIFMGTYFGVLGHSWENLKVSVIVSEGSLARGKTDIFFGNGKFFERCTASCFCLFSLGWALLYLTSSPYLRLHLTHLSDGFICHNLQWPEWVQNCRSRLLCTITVMQYNAQSITVLCTKVSSHMILYPKNENYKP